MKPLSLRPFALVMLLLAFTVGFGQLPATNDFGRQVKPMSPDQIAVFEKKVADFKGAPTTYEELLKLATPAIRREYPGQPSGANAVLSWGTDIGRCDLSFYWGPYTVLRGGFEAKLVLTFKNGATDTRYVTTDDDYLAHKRPISTYFIQFESRKITSLNLTLLVKDGKTLVKQTTSPLD